MHIEKKNILIASGCMAIQSFKENISEQDLYPYVLKATFLKEKNIELEFDIITYHKLQYCFNKIVDKVS
ncbi:MAG: hypothetical protein ACO3E1_04615 [Flavobacteriales bacterium]